MNIEFEKLQCSCNHLINDSTKCMVLGKGKSCTEANCPLKADEVALRMSNGVVQEMFTSLKAEEKVCRWVEVYSEDPDFDYPYYNVSCTESVSEDYLRKYCPNCGGKVVLK